MGIKAFIAVPEDLKFANFVTLKCKYKIFVRNWRKISPGPPKAIYATTRQLLGV